MEKGNGAVTDVTLIGHNAGGRPSSYHSLSQAFPIFDRHGRTCDIAHDFAHASEATENVITGRRIRGNKLRNRLALLRDQYGLMA